MMRIPIVPWLRLAVFLVFGALIFGAQPAYGASWQLIWADDFTGPDGSSPDPNKWGYDIGNGNWGWGNNQLEYDTARPENIRIQGGNLVIEARQESYQGFNYTSGRMNTKGKFSLTYGRVEARIKIPKGQGIWPAFWMLGANIDSVGWPACGEIDIMENIGKSSDQGTVHCTLHGPSPNQNGDYNWYQGLTSTYTLPNGALLSDDFHIYAVEWTPNQIQFFVDSNLVGTETPADVPSGGTWVFNAPQYIILNVAVGGQWPGNPDGTTVFPQQMLVNYVHVYDYVTTTTPAPPTSLAVTAGNGQAALTWAASSGAASYTVKRSTTSGGLYTNVATGLTSTSYTDTGLANGTTYYYVVTAVNSSGESPNSNEVSATPQNQATPPPAPAGLTATAGNAQVSLSWTAVSGATSYNIKRGTWSTFEYTTATVTGVNYTDTQLTNGTTYFYVITAVNSSGESANSNEVSATPQNQNTPPPAPPTGLATISGNGQAALTWTASSGATSYTVKRSTTSGGAYTSVATGLTSTSFTNTGLTNGTTYFYVVTAVNSSGESANSNEASATPQNQATPPPAPAGLTATAGNAQVSLSWTAVSGATSYNIKRGTWSTFEYTTANVTGVNFTDTQLNNGTTYFYVVTAVNNNGESASSNEVSATPQDQTTITPPAPTGLTATAGNAQVSLSWTAVSGATSYNIKRGTWSTFEWTTANVTGVNFTDTQLNNGTTYFYVVTAVNSSGESANSNEVSATPQDQTTTTPPPAPTGLAATAGNAQVSLSWTAVSGATSYNIKRGTWSTFEWTTANVTGVNFTDTQLANGTTYFYVVTAINSNGESANSNEVNATPVAAKTMQALAAASPMTASTGTISVGRPTQFTVYPAGTSPYQCTWDFGDGSSATGSATVEHTFRAAGTYTITATVTDATGQILTSTMAATVTGDIQPMQINSVIARFNTALKDDYTHDSCTLMGFIPGLPAFSPDQQLLIVSLQGVETTFKLDANGRAKTADGTVVLKFTLTNQSGTQSFLGGDVPFTMTLKNGAWKSAWGVNSVKSGDAFTLQVQLRLLDKTYGTSVTGTVAEKAGHTWSFNAKH